MWNTYEYQLQAVVKGIGGIVLPNVRVAWEIRDSAIVEIDAAGCARALKPGSTIISANAGGRKTNAYVTVFSLGPNGLFLELQPNQEP